MIESHDRVREIIPEEIMLARIEQSEQMRAFFIEMWKQNPRLAKQGGARVRNLMTPLESVNSEVGFPVSATAPIKSKQRGVSLIELIMFIVIISSALVGILSVMNIVSKNNADPVMHKQALAIAESLLEEIELQDFTAASGASGTTVNAGNRSNTYHIVTDYNGFSMPSPPGIISINGNNPPGLSGYSASVSVAPPAAQLGSIPATSSMQITVTVTDPSGNSIQSVGFRTAY